MLNTLVANRYASALLQEAEAQGKTDIVVKDLHTITSIIASSPDLRMLLRSPIIEAWRKKKIVLEVFEKDISDLTMSFLVLIIEKNREPVTREIVAQFFKQLDTLRNTLRVSVESATVMDENSKGILNNAIAIKRGGMTVESTYQVDPELLGGVRVTIGDMVFDGSLKNQLNALRERLASAS